MLNDIVFNCMEISRIVDGKILSGSSDTGITGAEVDSRRCVNGSLFVALDGERCDGHDYIAQAVEKGAVAALVAEGFSDRSAFNDISDTVTLIEVAHPLNALQQIAEAHVRKFENLIKIGVTGSSGKTTTRALITSVLEKKYNVLATEGNFNSEIGLPLMALRIRSQHEVAILEMGINRVGEMDILADIFKPDLAVVTNIGTAHIGLMGSVDIIAEQKGRIFKYFSEKSCGFIYENEKYFEAFSGKYHGDFVKYGEESQKYIENTGEDSVEGQTVALDGVEFFFPLTGEYNYRNLCAAVAVGRFLEVENDDIISALSEITLPSGRSRFVRGRVSVVEDCYNANPESMKESLEGFSQIGWDGSKIAVLGSMKELGNESERFHQELGEFASTKDLSCFIFTGEETVSAFEILKKNNFKNKAFWCSGNEEAATVLQDVAQEGDLVLLKGSRSMKLEELTDLLIGKKLESGETGA
jgi:UDP-N-acetylmuramoyl-tripeptide--D-alanyl-D-alanine ligase